MLKSLIASDRAQLCFMWHMSTAERRAWRTITMGSFCTHNSYPLRESSGGSPPSFSPKDRNCVYKMRNLLQFSTPALHG